MPDADDGALEIMLQNVERIVVVSDDEVRAAMKIYFTDTHNVVEGEAGTAGRGVERKRST
jgi:threonine dehydratase